MAIKLSRGVWLTVIFALLLVVGGKIGLDLYTAPVEDKSPIKVVDQKPADPRTTEELERIRYGQLTDEIVQRDCEAWVTEHQWMSGRQIADIKATEAGTSSAEVRELFRSFRTGQIDQYSRLTNDPESVRPSVRELLVIWANLSMDDPETENIARIGKLAQEALEAGSSDALVRAMQVCYQPAQDYVQAEKLLAELPNEVSKAGYNSTFRLLVQKNRFLQASSHKAVNLGAIAVKLIEDTVAYSDEFSANPELARVTWYSVAGVATQLRESEQRELYRELLISEKTDPLFLHLLAGILYKDNAWRTRGGSTVDTIPDAAWPKIEKSFGSSSLHYRKAWLLRPDLPQAASALIEISNASSGEEHWTPRQWFELTCRAQPDYMTAYTTFMYALLPRWGGSHEDLLAFGKECAGTKAFETPIPYVFIDCISQIAAETPGAKAWELPKYIRAMTEFWKSMEEWGDEHDKSRESSRWQPQFALQAAVMIRNGRYAEARKVLEQATWPPATAPMVKVLKDPTLGASMAYALSEADSEPMVEIEKCFGLTINKGATVDDLNMAIEAIVEAKGKSTSPRGSLYFSVRENSLRKQLSFLRGGWVELNFDDPLTTWTVQGGRATVESPASLHISNLGIGRTPMQAIPNVGFPPPYSVKAKLERIRGKDYFERVCITVGPASQANMLGEAGGMIFVTNDEPRVAGTFWHGKQQQWYFLNGLTDTVTMHVDIWPNEYRMYVNGTIIPVLPVSVFEPNSELSFGGNPFEAADGEIRISNVQIRKLTLPVPPDADSPLDERLAYLTHAVEAEPENLGYRMQFAAVLGQSNRPADALTQYEFVFRANPDFERVRLLFGNACFEAGRETEAAPLLVESMKSEPGNVVGIDTVAWMYATARTDSLRNGEESLRLATQICDQTQNGIWNFTATKAAALAELGRFPEAVTAMQQTIKLAPDEQHALLNRMLSAFEQKQPWRREDQK